MYAVIDDKGKQYKVAEGEQVRVDLMKAEPGDEVQFDRVLMVGGQEGAEAKLGQPTVEGAGVVAHVLGHEKGPKITMMRYGKGPTSTKRGHRQKYTRLVVSEINPG